MASPQTGIFALGTNSHAIEFDLVAAARTSEAVSRIAALRCLDNSRSFGGATNCRTRLHLRGLVRATPFIDAGCTDEGAEMSKHRVAAPIVGVERGA